MNATHLHLMLNHFPVMGTLFGFLLLAAGTWRKSEELKRASLVLFIGCAVAALPVFLTGKPSEKDVKGLPGTSGKVMEKHEEVAQVAMSLVLVLGGLSGSAFWLFRKGAPLPQGFVLLVLAVALASSGLMAWAANLGGEIRHTEIRLPASDAK